MAVVKTVKRDDHSGVDGFGYDVWDTIPEWKWEQVHRGQPWTNSNRAKNAIKRRRDRSKRNYTPRYQPIDILDKVKPVARNFAIEMLKGLL